MWDRTLPCPVWGSVPWTFLLLAVLQFGLSLGGSTCKYTSGLRARYVYCEYGCCGSENDRECCPYTVSSSVIIVAGIVGGLVVLALVVAFIICCVKNYKDKQSNRVRSLPQPTDTSRTENIQRPPATVPKPPAYQEAPPPYSLNMPAQHFRPQTVMSSRNSNTRFQRSQAHPRTSDIPQENRNPISHTATSGIYPPDTNRHRNVYPPASDRQDSVQPPPSTTFPQQEQRNTNTTSVTSQSRETVPGAIHDHEPPPAYSEFQRGFTPHPTNNLPL